MKKERVSPNNLARKLTNTSMPTRDFNKYLLAEYQNIAKAHFGTIAAISSFFRYYLIIMAFPVTLFSAFIGLSPKEENIIFSSGLPLSFISLVIALIGFCVLLYIANLRMDALLYARTVNAIRKYFYDNSNIDIDAKLRTRVLPQTAFLPGYFETRYFLPVVVSFALFNVLYFLFGLILLTTPLVNVLRLTSWDEILNWARGISPWIWVAPVIFFFAHVISYGAYSRYRELAYLRSYAMGVDIDGVLNSHRYHFCKLLNEIVEKQLDPEQITTIPVHENPNLGVSRDDEKQVFNNPRYWVEMPCVDDAAKNIRRLRNAFKLKIHIFTHRQWPSDEIRKTKDAYKKWVDSASHMLEQSIARVPGPLHRLRGLYIAINKARMKIKIWPLELKPIDRITKCWLRINDIEYDALIIEKGSEDVSDPRGQFRNRFNISRKRRLRFFVEDDDEKANKLAYICDVVFLLEQPYNQNKKLPNNVLRVKSWDEIYRYIRKLS